MEGNSEIKLIEELVGAPSSLNLLGAEEKLMAADQGNALIVGDLAVIEDIKIDNERAEAPLLLDSISPSTIVT